MWMSGELVDDVFYLADIIQGYTNTAGKPYLSIAMINKTGDLEGRYWDMDISRLNAAKGDYARVQGTVQTFNGAVQLKVMYLQKVAPVDMTRESTVSFENLLIRLADIVGSIPEGSLSRELWDKFSMSEMYMAFLDAPAATSMHHNYKHGLLEHSVTVAELVYPRLPQEELGIGIAASLIHDVGKIQTYAFEGPAVTMTQAGKMLGHIVLGVMAVQPLLAGLPDEFSTLFLNAIVGHHGKLEWGSPELPKTRFAWLIHRADMMDAATQHIADMPAWDGWSAPDKMFRTEMYSFGN